MNPFKKNNQVLPKASINSVYINDKLASELFRPSILIDVINQYRDELGLSREIQNNDLLYRFNESLNSDIESIQFKAIEIAKEFGLRLSKLLVTLKKPSKVSVLNRSNWNEDCWNYWKNTKKVTFVGGLTSPILTKIFLDVINEELQKNQIEDLRVSFIEGSSNLGTKGLSTQFEYGEALLFDFGQTNIKRAHVIKENGELILESYLSSVKSDFLFYKFRDDYELMILANKLHNKIIDEIINTINEVQFKGEKILISIANYVNQGKIYLHRGGYGKLALLSDNYLDYLKGELSSKLEKEMDIELFHDTTAMSFAFDQSKKRVVISLGTAFGVAFID